MWLASVSSICSRLLRGSQAGNDAVEGASAPQEAAALQQAPDQPPQQRAEPPQAVAEEGSVDKRPHISASATAGLGVDLLAQVLRFVPQGQRLTKCARVSQEWAAAAAAATTSVDALRCFNAEARPLEAWLTKHGPRLRELQLGPSQYRWLQATALQPLQRLQRLQLLRVKIEPSDAGDTGSSAFPLPTALTSLHLETCTLVAPLGLSGLSGLRHLHLLQLRLLPASGQQHGAEFDAALQQHAAALDDALQQLSQLTHLVITVNDNQPAAGPFQQLTCLHSLQELGLSVSESTLPSLAVLPPSLTAVSVWALAGGWQLSAATAPGLGQLTGLQALRLSGEAVYNDWEDAGDDDVLEDEFVVDFVPDFLPQLPQLTRLDVQGGGSQFLPQLLAAASRLTRLQHLRLAVVLPEEMEAAALSPLAALTALTQLSLHSYSSEWPAGAAARLFHNERGPRPALRVLRLSSHKPSPPHAGSDDEEPDSAGSDADNQDGLLSSADDVASLVTCCPGLQELNLTITLAGAPLRRLRQLTGLQKLRLGGSGIDDRALLDLAKLTQLRCLVLGSRPKCFSLLGLLQLMQLRQLTRLASLFDHFHGDGDDDDDDFWEDGDDRVFDIRNCEQASILWGSGEVWRQLYSYVIEMVDYRNGFV